MLFQFVNLQVRHTTTTYSDIDFAKFRDDPHFIKARMSTKWPVWGNWSINTFLGNLKFQCRFTWCGCPWFSTQPFPLPSSSRSTHSYMQGSPQWDNTAFPFSLISDTYTHTSSYFLTLLHTIPHICYFFYTGKIFQAKILHPKAHKLRQIKFRDKIA